MTFLWSVKVVVTWLASVMTSISDQFVFHWTLKCEFKDEAGTLTWSDRYGPRVGRVPIFQGEPVFYTWMHRQRGHFIQLHDGGHRCAIEQNVSTLSECEQSSD